MKFVAIFFLCGILASSFADVAKKDVSQTATFKIVEYQDFPPMRETILEERTVSFASLEDLFTKIPTTNLQKALFYLGFFPNEVSDENAFLGELRRPYFNNEIPSDAMMLHAPKIVNATKAYSIIVDDIFKRKELNKKRYRTCPMSVPLFLTMHIEGIGCEKSHQIAFHLIRKHPMFSMSIDEINKCSVNNFNCYYKASIPIVSYMYYYGLGVETDKAKSKAIIQSMNKYEVWRNFYIGYLAPKNEEFAIFILECSDEFWTALELSKIYAGFYNKNRIDLEKSRFWQAEFERRKQQYIKDFVEYKLKRSDSIIWRALCYGFEKCVKTEFNKFTNIEFSNPYYNPQKSMMYIEEMKKYPKLYEKFLFNIDCGIDLSSLNFHSLNDNLLAHYYKTDKHFITWKFSGKIFDELKSKKTIDKK